MAIVRLPYSMNALTFASRVLHRGESPRSRTLRTRMLSEISVRLSHKACTGVSWKTTLWAWSLRNAGPARPALQHAGLAHDPQVRLDARQFGHQPHSGSHLGMSRLSTAKCQRTASGSMASVRRICSTKSPLVRRGPRSGR